MYQTILALAAAPLFMSAQRACAAGVDQRRLEAADNEPGQWLSNGRTWDEQRFSPLKLINEGNVKGLGLAWYAPLSTFRGVEATPLMIDGVLYNVSAWDITTAYEAATGKVLWTFRADLPDLLRPGDLLVVNDTRVIPAQLEGMRGDARIGVTLDRPRADGAWHALVRNARRLRVGDVVRFDADLGAEVLALDGGDAVLRFDCPAEAVPQALQRPRRAGVAALHRPSGRTVCGGRP